MNWRWSLFASALLVGVASSASPADELNIAREALRDGLWSTARVHAQKVGGEVGELVILESYAHEKRWDDIRKVLADSTIASTSTNAAYRYYRAVTEGRIEQAIAALQAGGSEIGAAGAMMLEAELCSAKGDMVKAKELWREVLSVSNTSERVRAVASINLNNPELLKRTYAELVSSSLKRLVGLRLGRLLLDAPDSRSEGERLIRAIVAENPDAEGAREAFVALVVSKIQNECWEECLKIATETTEIWPDAAKVSLLHECRGTALHRTGQVDDAIVAFQRATELTTNREDLARILLKEGEALTDDGRGEEAMKKYRAVLTDYPMTTTAATLKDLVMLREKESKGRDYYHQYRFEEARKIFAEVASADRSRRARMQFNEVLCLYGLGRDEAALRGAQSLAESCTDLGIRAEAVLWLAKLRYNRKDWKKAVQLFERYFELQPKSPSAVSALFWATRAAFAASDSAATIACATKLIEHFPASKEAASAYVIQAEVLIEQARFDEAILVLEQVAIADGADSEDRIRATILKGDAYFALGADNPARYESALETYRKLVLGVEIPPRTRISVAFKIGRVLEKMKRVEEAIDQYYSQVILAYRDGRMRGTIFDDGARAAFSRAAFRLADIFEARGRDSSAYDILKLVVESAVPAGDEAAKRMDRIMKKGRFL